MSEIKGYIKMPFHGESAYDIAVRYGYEGGEKEWIDEIGKMSEADLKNVMKNFSDRLCGYTWYADSDVVTDKEKREYGSLEDCMTEDFVGSCFFVRTSDSDCGSCIYPEKYVIDGANGYLSLRDYVVWTGDRLVHIPTFEAKSSTIKNSDGKYSPKSGVDGLMSSTDKAYLTDLINSFWGKECVPLYKNPDPTDGWMVNWCRDDGIYLGGIKKNCGGHPPVVGDNHTSWVVMVFNGMNTGDGNRNHRVQIAFDVVNSKIYMRRGWISSNEWAKEWSEVGKDDEKSDVIIVTDDYAVDGIINVDLNRNIKEVVVKSSIATNIIIPEDTWKHWRVIINLTDGASCSVDVGTESMGMFGLDKIIDDEMGGDLELGKTYICVKQGDGTSPASYPLYMVDNVTREKV